MDMMDNCLSSVTVDSFQMNSWTEIENALATEVTERSVSENMRGVAG